MKTLMPILFYVLHELLQLKHISIENRAKFGESEFFTKFLAEKKEVSFFEVITLTYFLLLLERNLEFYSLVFSGLTIDQLH